MRFSRVFFVLLVLGFALSAASPPHRLEANGSHGWMKFWGDGTVDLSGRGTLTIQNASNQQLDVKGTWGEMEKLADGAQYTHFEGKVHSLGLGIHIELRGWDLALSTRGVRGTAWFRGGGTATLDGDPPQAWADHPDKWLKVKYE